VNQVLPCDVMKLPRNMYHAANPLKNVMFVYSSHKRHMLYALKSLI